MTDTTNLRAELAAARDRVSGKTFAEAPELFKDIESIKVRIRQAEGRYQWMARVKSNGA